MLRIGRDPALSWLAGLVKGRKRGVYFVTTNRNQTKPCLSVCLSIYLSVRGNGSYLN